jgi:ubiquinone/menaquinone biosynthesis C-methylase UbiE
MKKQPDFLNIQMAAAAFSAQASYFDQVYSANEIIQYKRNRVRNHLLKYLNPNSHILELNAGTGEDAIFLARLGHRVHATDIAEGMHQALLRKISHTELQKSISTEACSFTALENLQTKGPFDCILSNFAGLNCTGDLRLVLESFDQLLKPGAIAVLVILPKFCIWETLMVFKGKFKTAFRRFFSGHGRLAKIDLSYFKCWYYNPRFIQNVMGNKFSVLALEGLCTFVPPSYIISFPEKYPKLYRKLQKTEDKLKSQWPWHSIGDYYIISFRKN